jgi:hypothetical protein
MPNTHSGRVVGHSELIAKVLMNGFSKVESNGRFDLGECCPTGRADTLVLCCRFAWERFGKEVQLFRCPLNRTESMGSGF